MVDVDLELITNEMDKLKQDKARYQFELKQVEKQIERLELTLIAVLNQAQVKDMEFNGYTFGFKETTRVSLDQKKLKELYPKQFEDCYLPKTKEDFYFKCV